MISEEKITRNLQKRLPNGVPTGALILGNLTLAPVLAPLAPQVVFLLKNAANVLQRWSQGCKSDSKRDPKVVEVGPRQWTNYRI